MYVVSGFSRTVTGPPEGGHYLPMEIAVAAEHAEFDALSAVSAVKYFVARYLALDQKSRRLAVPAGMPVRWLRVA